jgi:hypothetical protein
MARPLRALFAPDQGVMWAGLMGCQAACPALIADGQFRIKLQQGNAPLFSCRRQFAEGSRRGGCGGVVLRYGSWGKCSWSVLNPFWKESKVGAVVVVALIGEGRWRQGWLGARPTRERGRNLYK